MISTSTTTETNTEYNDEARPCCIEQNEWGKIDFVKQKALVAGDDVDTDTGDESDNEQPIGKYDRAENNGKFYQAPPDEKPPMKKKQHSSFL